MSVAALFCVAPRSTLRHHLAAYGPLRGLTGLIAASGQGTISLLHHLGAQCSQNERSLTAGAGVVYPNGEAHRQQRCLIMPSLHKNKQMPMIVHPQDRQFTCTPAQSDVLKLMALP